MAGGTGRAEKEEKAGVAIAGRREGGGRVGQVEGVVGRQ